MKKRKILLIMLVLAILGVLTGVIFVVHGKKQEENTINQYCEEINALLDSFQSEEDKNEKLNDYKELNTLYEKYLNSDEHYDKVTSSYETALSTMQEYFKDYYEKEIESFTLDVSNEEDRNKLKEFIASCDALSEEMGTDAVLTDTTAIENQINSNIENYNNKIDEVTNSYYEGKIAENKIEDLASVGNKESLNAKIEALNGITNELDSDEFIKEDKRNEFKQIIQSNIDGYTNRVAEIDAAEKAEAERIAQQAVANNNNNKNSSNKNNSNSNNSGSSSSQQTSSSTSSKPANSGKRWTQEVDGVVYTAPQNVSDLYYAGHGIQLNITYIGEPSWEGEELGEIQQVLVFWIDHTTGIDYDEWGNALN